jgi:hypothetical protein
MSLVVRSKIQKRVGLVVLFKSFTGSADLVEVRKTLCRVGDWSSVRTQAIKLYSKFDMITDCLFMKIPVGAMELTT